MKQEGDEAVADLVSSESIVRIEQRLQGLSTEGTDQALDAVRRKVQDTKAKAQILNGKKNLKLFKLENIKGIEVMVKKAVGYKCPRCWKIFEKSCNRCKNVKIT